MNSRGFTLVELVMVIVITGIIAATGTVFFKPAVDSYFSTQRRATLTDIADTALRKMARDIRSAVPNSIRWPNNSCLELVPTSTGGRYRMVTDTASAGSVALDISQPVSQFDVLSPTSATAPAADWVVPANGDYVVIDNQNTNDVYAGTNRAVISSAPSTAAVKDSLGNATNVYRISIGSTQFPSGYTGGRFVVVPYNSGRPSMVYACSGADGTVDTYGNGKGTLYQVTQAFNSTYPTSCPSVPSTYSSILATNVKTCKWVYNASQDGTQQSAFVWIQLEIAQANETVALAYGVHVDNVP